MAKASEFRLWRTAAQIGGLSLVIWLSSMYLWFVYAGTRPHIPDPNNGRVYSLITHGSVVYLTRAEEVRLDGLMIIGGLGLITAIAIHLNYVKSR
jgi:hypothetical protein